MPKTTNEQIKDIKEAIKNTNYRQNEKVWTYLFAEIIEQSSNKKEYLEKLLGENIFISVNDIQLWTEAQPLPPRFKEGNTKLDLSFGGITEREDTGNGIEYDPSINWVCFVEAKLFADCSTDVSHDPYRNQLARIIENLVTFQKRDHKHTLVPKHAYFTLLTPRNFKERPFTKLYGYKYFEYHDRQRLQHEFYLSELDKRNEERWKYPDDIGKRLSALKLNWVSFEDILEHELQIKDMDVTKIGEGQMSPIINNYIKNKTNNQ
jgi:hypothetical protein